MILCLISYVLGYGDVIPCTVIGRGFACCFMLFGAVTISLPVLTIVSQFTELYPKNVEYDSYVESQPRSRSMNIDPESL